MSPRPRPSRRRSAARELPAARGARRGFTMVELLIATAAGMFVAAAALLLSKNASQFFQHEARVAAAQLAATIGMNRLTGELQRASFLGTRNNATDPRLCSDGVALPAELSQLAGLRVTRGGSVLAHGTDLAQSTSADNAMRPDSVVIAGSLATSEVFTVADVAVTSAGAVVTLRTGTDEAMYRVRATAAQSGQTLATGLSTLFMPGRFLRLRDDDGFLMWGIIGSLAVSGTAPDEVVRVTLTSSPGLPDRNTNSRATCGLRGTGRGLLASVVHRARYDLRSLRGTASFAALVASDTASEAITGASGRTELVRVELDASGVERPETLELVAELAVNLKFGVTKVPAGAVSAWSPTLTSYAFDEAAVESSPELVRAVLVQLSTRTRVPDRSTPLGSGGRPYTFAVLPSGQAAQRFARLRTLVTTVMLPSQKDFAL